MVKAERYFFLMTLDSAITNLNTINLEWNINIQYQIQSIIRKLNNENH